MEAKMINSDLLDKSKPLRMAKKDELTDELLNKAIELDSKLWIGNLQNKQIAKALGMDTSKPIKLTMKGHDINHALKRHGADSNAAIESKKPILELQDFAMHDYIVNHADKQQISTNKDEQKVLVSGKQINGYYIVIETISTKQNELKLKTIYKEKGNLQNAEAFKS